MIPVGLGEAFTPIDANPVLSHVQFEASGLTGFSAHPTDVALRRARQLRSYANLGHGGEISHNQSLQVASSIATSGHSMNQQPGDSDV